MKLKVIVQEMKSIIITSVVGLTTLLSCAQKSSTINTKSISNMKINTKTDTATFANGCFWCTEAIFEELDGVVSATSGYTGGNTKNPTYKEVCTGETGHAECLQIVYDPMKITFDELLEVFWGNTRPYHTQSAGSRYWHPIP